MVGQHTVALRWANQSDSSGRKRYLLCNLFHEASRTPWKKRFVTPHPRAISANQYKSGGIHAQIVALASHFPGIMRSNNLALARYVFPKLASRHSGESTQRKAYLLDHLRPPRLNSR